MIYIVYVCKYIYLWGYILSAINTCAKLSADNTFTGINTFSKKMVGQVRMNAHVSAGSDTKPIAFIPMMPDKENLSNGIRLRIECFDVNCLYEIFVSTGTAAYTSSSPPSSTDFYFNVLNKTNYDRARNVYLLYYNNPTTGVAGIGIYTDALTGSRRCMYSIADNSRSGLDPTSFIDNSIAPVIATNPPVANQDNVVWVITAPNVSYANTTKDNTFTGINTFQNGYVGLPRYREIAGQVKGWIAPLKFTKVGDYTEILFTIKVIAVGRYDIYDVRVGFTTGTTPVVYVNTKSNAGGILPSDIKVGQLNTSTLEFYVLFNKNYQWGGATVGETNRLDMEILSTTSNVNPDNYQNVVTGQPNYQYYNGVLIQ